MRVNASVLFVDDEKAILHAMQRIFAHQKYHSLFASTAEEALKILAEHQVDIIVTDRSMPGMDGYSLLEKVSQEYPHTIRVMISGYLDDQADNQDTQAGLVNHYINKPWQIIELRKKINTFLDEKFNSTMNDPNNKSE